MKKKDPSDPAPWPSVEVKSKGTHDVFFEYSWMIFPNPVDPRLTIPQKTALRKVIRLLRGRDLMTVGHLIQMDPDRLRFDRGVGRQTVELIELYLGRIGLSLNTALDPGEIEELREDPRQKGLPDLDVFLDETLGPHDAPLAFQAIRIELTHPARAGRTVGIPEHISEVRHFRYYAKWEIAAIKGMRSEWVDKIEGMLRLHEVEFRAE